jgi:DNA transformation protein
MNTASFREFVLDHLAGLGQVRCHPMFGGHGLYLGDVFFGVLSKGALYFKTDLTTRPTYVKVGMKPFRPNSRQLLKHYYQVPADIIEDSDQFVLWARDAIRCQLHGQHAPRRSTGKRQASPGYARGGRARM